MKYRLFGILFVTILSIVFVSQYTGPTSANDDKSVRAASVIATMEARSPRYPLLPVEWLTVVNNGMAVPGSEQMFSSYGQPSVSTDGVVVFRGRTTGSSERQSGVYKRRDLSSPIEDVADLDMLVPYPNNLDVKFGEFPSIPRISENGENTATRANHKPIYRYVLQSGEETRVGTTGVYVQMGNSSLVTGASKLGAVPGFEYFRVPGIEPAVPFSVFPGSAAINDDGTVVLKGNYSIDDTEKTGVFYRRVLNTPGGGGGEFGMIANSDTTIPNPPDGNRVKFGSTAPPSIVGDDVVFVGLDNEDNPHRGGIYMASLSAPRTEAGGHQLRTVAHIGQTGSRLTHFSWIGESLSFDGRYVSFWGAQGEGMKTIRLNCPVDGNAELIAYCNGVDPNSIFDAVTEQWYQLKQVPTSQSIYVYDRIADQTVQVSSTSSDFDDYLFWVYSGRPPGTGEEEEAEPPRWRASAFVSVHGGIVAFKARTATLDPNGNYVNIVDGLYLKSSAGLETVMETGMDGALIDPTLEPGEMLISALGIEREGVRGPFLAITATMENAEESWGGIYMANVSAVRTGETRKVVRK